MFQAWLCYEHPYEDDDPTDQRIIIRFSEPNKWAYQKVVPICFSILKDYNE